MGLTGLNVPTRGMRTVPGYLRIRYIPFEPLIWNGSIMFNLRFGCQDEVEGNVHTDEEVFTRRMSVNAALFLSLP